MPIQEYGFFPETLPSREKVRSVVGTHKSRTCDLLIVPFSIQR